MGEFFPTRKRLRCRGFDYSTAGAYFITICTADRAPLFGCIENQNVILSPLGEVVKNAWLNLATYHPRVSLDEFCVMPDHLHGIIGLLDLKNAQPLVFLKSFIVSNPGRPFFADETSVVLGIYGNADTTMKSFVPNVC